MNVTNFKQRFLARFLTKWLNSTLYFLIPGVFVSLALAWRAMDGSNSWTAALPWAGGLILYLTVLETWKHPDEKTTNWVEFLKQVGKNLVFNLALVSAVILMLVIIQAGVDAATTAEQGPEQWAKKMILIFLGISILAPVISCLMEKEDS